MFLTTFLLIMNNEQCVTYYSQVSSDDSLERSAENMRLNEALLDDSFSLENSLVPEEREEAGFYQSKDMFEESLESPMKTKMLNVAYQTLSGDVSEMQGHGDTSEIKGHEIQVRCKDRGMPVKGDDKKMPARCMYTF